MQAARTRPHRRSRAVERMSALGRPARISSFGIAGLLFMSGVYFVGGLIESRRQDEADRSSLLAANVATLSLDILEAERISTEFLRTRTEVAVTAFARAIERARRLLAAIDALVAPLDPADPLRQAARFRSTINMYATRFRNV